MNLLNAGCGGQRPSAPWTNMDTLRSQLAIGTPERTNLDAEPNYVDHDMRQPWPFPDGHFDGIVMIHVLEHLTCHEAVAVLKEARRCLRLNGVILASVPNAEYFYNVKLLDRPANAMKLFGEPIHDAGHDSFRSYALFRHDHIQLLESSSMKCLFIQAGFDYPAELKQVADIHPLLGTDVLPVLLPMLNRRMFSCEIVATK